MMYSRTSQHNKDGDLVSFLLTTAPQPLTSPHFLDRQWVIIDAKVYDLSRFANLHPGGRAVLVDGEVAGQDATAAFYGLHRHEVLERPQYARLQVGVVRGEKSVITGRLVGGLSKVPYGEPTYLTEGFHSPYYTEVRFAFCVLGVCCGRAGFLSWREALISDCRFAAWNATRVES